MEDVELDSEIVSDSASSPHLGHWYHCSRQRYAYSIPS